MLKWLKNGLVLKNEISAISVKDAQKYMASTNNHRLPVTPYTHFFKSPYLDYQVIGDQYWLKVYQCFPCMTNKLNLRTTYEMVPVIDIQAAMFDLHQRHDVLYKYEPSQWMISDRFINESTRKIMYNLKHKTTHECVASDINAIRPDLMYDFEVDIFKKLPTAEPVADPTILLNGRPIQAYFEMISKCWSQFYHLDSFTFSHFDPPPSVLKKAQKRQRRVIEQTQHQEEIREELENDKNGKEPVEDINNIDEEPNYDADDEKHVLYGMFDDDDIPDDLPRLGWKRRRTDKKHHKELADYYNQERDQEFKKECNHLYVEASVKYIGVGGTEIHLDSATANTAQMLMGAGWKPQQLFVPNHTDAYKSLIQKLPPANVHHGTLHSMLDSRADLKFNCAYLDWCGHWDGNLTERMCPRKEFELLISQCFAAEGLVALCVCCRGGSKSRNMSAMTDHLVADILAILGHYNYGMVRTYKRLTSGIHVFLMFEIKRFY